MRTVRIELKSLNGLELELIHWPELRTSNRTVQKGLELFRKGFPRTLRAIARQKVISEIKEYQLELFVSDSTLSVEQIKKTLWLWLQRKKHRRLFFIFVELLLMPLSGILAILPGPNLFFYFLFVFFFFHFKGFIHLNRLKPEELKICVIRKNTESGWTKEMSEEEKTNRQTQKNQNE